MTDGPALAPARWGARLHGPTWSRAEHGLARRIRLDGPALAHHVMIRGLDGGTLFHDADDRHDFVDRMARVLPSCGARCFAWALMSNHVHFVLQTEAGTLSRVMRRLNTGHALRLNRRTERRGYVFMDRFRSRLVEDDADLIGLIRYVHRNPLEAGLVRSLGSLATYPWSGHGALVGTRGPHPFEAAREALALFDGDPDRARTALQRWMAGPEEAPTIPEPRTRSTVPVGKASDDDSLQELFGKAAAHYDLEPHELASGGKQPRIARARAALAHVTVVEMSIPGTHVARALGVSHAAISAALDRGRRFCEEDGFARTEKLATPRGESEI